MGKAPPVMTPTDALQTAPAGTLVPTRYPADQHPALIYLAGLAPGSRRVMARALDTIADLLTAGRCDLRSMPWGVLRFQHVAAVRAALAARYAPATANRALSALRGVLRACWRLGLMTAEELARCLDVERIKHGRPAQAAGRAITPGEWAALVKACEADTTPAGARDAAILALLRVAGLRRAEVADLELAGVTLVPGAAAVTVTGKGRKMRTIPLEDPGALGALADWVHVRGDDPGPLFWQIRRGGHVVPGAGLTAQGVYRIIDARREAAGVAPFSPHDARRTFAGDLLDAGADLVTVQKLMGHASPQTTAGYDRRDERAKRRAAGLIHLPYTRRFS